MFKTKSKYTNNFVYPLTNAGLAREISDRITPATDYQLSATAKLSQR